MDSENLRIEVLHSQYAESMRMTRQWIALIDGGTIVDARGSVRRFKDYDTALKAARKALQSSANQLPKE